MKPKAKAKAKAQTTAMKAMKTMKAMKAKPTIPLYTVAAKAPCPKVGDGPVDCKGGRIYTSLPKRAFRVIRERGDYYSEKSSKWAKADKPDRKAWQAALKSVDEHNKKAN